MIKEIGEKILEGIKDDRNNVVLRSLNDKALRIDIFNKKTNHNEFIIVTELIFFDTIEGREYYELIDYNRAIQKFINNLNKIIIILINLKEKDKIISYSFYGEEKKENIIIKSIKEKIISERMTDLKSFIATDFYGDYLFSGKFILNEIIIDN